MKPSRILLIFALTLAGLKATPMKVILDQDAALSSSSSNMQALLMFVLHPDAEVLGITITSGDRWMPVNVKHTLRMLEVAERTDIPVIPGALFPLVNSEARTEIWEELYGELFYKGAMNKEVPDGVTVERPPYHPPHVVPDIKEGNPTTQPADDIAAAFMVRMARKYPGEITFFAAGPLTNVALAVRLDSEFPRLAKQLVIMGGSFAPQAYDSEFALEFAHAPRKEFNWRWDPEAAHIVLTADWPRIQLYPIDPTTGSLYQDWMKDAIADSDSPIADYIGAWGMTQFPLWDEGAAASILNPALIKRQETLLVDCDTTFGPSYGDTLSWPLGHGPNLGERPVDVIFQMHNEALEQYVVDVLTQELE